MPVKLDKKETERINALWQNAANRIKATLQQAIENARKLRQAFGKLAERDPD